MLPIAILAGGLATRLRPLADSRPKALVEVNGEAFLGHQLRLLRTARFDRVVLCVGHLGDMVRDYAGDGSRFDLHIEYSEDGPRHLGTGGALRKALPLLGEAFFALYGDSYLPCDYEGIERAFLAGDGQALMTVFRNEGRWDRSNVEFSDGQILAYDKLNRTRRMRHIDYGLGVFRASTLAKLPAGEAHDLGMFYQELLRRHELAGFEVTGRFYEIGSLEGLRDFSEFLRGRGV
jgi:N-acetyl-alpha-D-muramate 1-phosphate uridylyltransferase